MIMSYLAVIGFKKCTLSLIDTFSIVLTTNQAYKHWTLTSNFKVIRS
jgi:hypothetical protein